MPLPIYEEWHADVNFFDKILAKIFPDKYGGRFSTRRLNIQEIFSKIDSIQNYPIDTRGFSFEKHVSVVTLNNSGSQTWYGRPTAKGLIEKPGFDVDALLPQNDSPDLDAVESTIETLPMASSPKLQRTLLGCHSYLNDFIAAAIY